MVYRLASVLDERQLVLSVKDMAPLLLVQRNMFVLPVGEVVRFGIAVGLGRLQIPARSAEGVEVSERVTAQVVRGVVPFKK